jgi:hypothetical protein
MRLHLLSACTAWGAVCMNYEFHQAFKNKKFIPCSRRREAHPCVERRFFPPLLSAQHPTWITARYFRLTNFPPLKLILGSVPWPTRLPTQLLNSFWAASCHRGPPKSNPFLLLLQFPTQMSHPHEGSLRSECTRTRPGRSL